VHVSYDAQNPALLLLAPVVEAFTAFGKIKHALLLGVQTSLFCPTQHMPVFDIISMLKSTSP